MSVLVNAFSILKVVMTSLNYFDSVQHRGGRGEGGALEIFSGGDVKWPLGGWCMSFI